jgi:SAM-dependent methyltransferase
MLGRFGPTMGVDLSPVAIHRAQVLYPDIRFVAGDLFDLELPSQSFDVVVSVQVIDHMDNQARFIELVARLLAPGGHLILVTTNARNVSYWTPQHFERFASGLQPIERWLTPRELKSLLLPYFRPRRIWTILPILGDRGVFASSARSSWRGPWARSGSSAFMRVRSSVRASASSWSASPNAWGETSNVHDT